MDLVRARTQSVVQPRNRVGEVGAIEDVVDLAAELEVHSLREVESLVQGQVKLRQPRTVQRPAAQIAESAIEEIRAEGMAVGLFRPITVWPYPMEALRSLSKRIKKIAVFEFCMGQMLEDVILSVGERAEITFNGLPGGIIPTPAEVAEFLRSALQGDGKIGRRVLV